MFFAIKVAQLSENQMHRQCWQRRESTQNRSLNRVDVSLTTHVSRQQKTQHGLHSMGFTKFLNFVLLCALFIATGDGNEVRIGKLISYAYRHLGAQNFF